MKKPLLSFLFVLFIFSAFSFSNNSYSKSKPFTVPAEPDLEMKTRMAEEAFLHIYNGLEYAGFEKPSYRTFRKGLIGFLNLKQAQKEDIKNILTLVDFNLPSTQKRMWVIDLNKMKVLFHELTSHGRNSGENFATNFSNVANSNTSSLGFFLTGEKYIGKYGKSLRLDGMEKGFNDLARSRAIVLHGADYVSQAFADAQGRLGRSYGCPAVPWENKDAIVDAIAEKSVLFISGPHDTYEQSSVYLNQMEAFDYFASQGFMLLPQA